MVASVTATVTRYLGLRFWLFTQEAHRVERLQVSAENMGDA